MMGLTPVAVVLPPQNQCPMAAESAVIGFSHPVKGQGEQNLLIHPAQAAGPGGADRLLLFSSL